MINQQSSDPYNEEAEQVHDTDEDMPELLKQKKMGELNMFKDLSVQYYDQS